MKRSLFLFVLLMAVWLLWSGHYSPFLIGLGALSCALVVLLARRMGLISAAGVPDGMLLRFLAYVPYLLVEIVKANLDVARRILSPEMPIAPRVFQTAVQQDTDTGRVIYANSITLTPGTVSIGVEPTEITVHGLTGEAAQGVLSDEMNRRVARVEHGR